MPYRRVGFLADEYYHIYNRGTNFQPIFFERDNYLFFLRQLRQYLVPKAVEITAYCLMPTHYHILGRLVTDDLSAHMQPFALSYTKAINRRFGRVGSLFQGRYKAIHVDRDAYLLHLSRYIHLNPVRAGLVQRPEDWEFSSYREFIGLRMGTLPKPEIVLGQFSPPGGYREFVEAYGDVDRQIIARFLPAE
jgi:putative transposase